MAPSRSSYYFSACTCLFILLLSLSVWSGEAAGNIDTLEPIVRLSPATAASADYFGYSVTLHQVKVPRSFGEALDNTRIIVGAPKGTFPGGVTGLTSSITPESETGLVYDCPILQGSCGRIGNGEGDDIKLFDSEPDAFVRIDLTKSIDTAQNNGTEMKTNQLMGATIVSSGEFFVACAPLYTVAFQGADIFHLDTRRPIGRCFVSPRNLTGFVEIRPCIPSSTIGVRNPNRCVTGTSAAINQVNDQSVVAIGAPGLNNFQGSGFLYQVNDTSANIVRGTFNSIIDGDTQYESYAMTLGNITGRDALDYILSVPRANGSDYRGSVVIRNGDDFFNVVPTEEIRGTQLAEYFGWSVAAADLNGDGYDEVIVGAPLYSTSSIQEHGQAYVFRNTGGNISIADPIILTGDTAPKARFGTSMVKLGDVNDDGFEDIAIGAPYQNVSGSNTGKVFIYYGRGDLFIDNIADQTITAETVASTTGQIQLKTFGWSLTSGVDVDNNEYMDLLVGAYESSTAVLFRALSVARIEIMASSDLTDNMLPIDLTRDDVSFNLRICASFTGRGLTGSLDTMLTINEVVGSSGARRLRFDRLEDYSKSFVFSAANEQTCKDVVVTITDKSSLYSGQLTNVEDLQIQFTLSQEPRMTPEGYDGNPETLSDLRSTPILIVNGNQSFTAIPVVTCGNGVCEPDLDVSIVDQRYIFTSDVTKAVYPDIVAGSAGVDNITVPLLIENRNVDAAIGATLQISIPTQFEYNIMDSSPSISCNAIVAGGPQYNCILPTFIGGSQMVPINLTWIRRQSAVIVGTEKNFTSNISVIVDRDTDLANNNARTIIEFGAVADLEITALRLRGPPTYNSETPPTGFTRFDQLGDRVELLVMLQNRGPSMLQSSIPSQASLNISIPIQDSTTGDNYYLYPGSYTVMGNGSATVTCDSGDFNPLNLQQPIGGSRRKRSTRTRRQDSAAQDSGSAPIPQDSLIKNCSASPSTCNVINCTVRNWGPNQPITITISSYLDRRFFSTRNSPFTFVAHTNIEVISPVTRDDTLQNNQEVSDPYSIMRMMEEGNNTIFTIVIPIVAVIGALILIIALFCLLYFVGFFRRKKYDKEEPEDMDGAMDLQVREVPPEEETVNGGKTAPPPGEEITRDQESTPDKEAPHENDIGDTSDLHDGEIVAADADPDETSL